MTIPNILIVEDEPLIAMDIERRLMRLGYKVTAIADSFDTTLEAVAEALPDLVLMDIQLRGKIDGIQTAAHLRQHYRLPIVYLTAHADAATLEQAKITHPFGYIVKPFENHDLSTAIEIGLSRHQAEYAIQNALEREKKLNEMKSHFVAMVSHEFRNPLASIQFALDLLKFPEDQVSAAKKQTYIQRAESCVQRMKELLEDVLIVGEAESSNFQCHPMPMDLQQFCRDLVDDFQVSLGSNHSIVFAEQNATLLPDTQYFLDEKLLRHILINLLSNAIKYSPQHSQVQFELIYHPHSVTFRIQDQGIGIPLADQAALFTPFHRGTNASKIPGTGLGLSIVKRSVDIHGGSITVESDPGQGTTFTVMLQSQN